MKRRRLIKSICNDLKALLGTTLDEPDKVLALADEVAEHPDGLQAVALLLQLLEQNPNLDWGMPGSVVHAVEAFFKKGYEPLLLDSLQRLPTTHTLWMANRLINDGLPKKQLTEFVSAMRNAAQRMDVTEVVRQVATDFLEYQGESN